jgi:hypothetical protein
MGVITNHPDENNEPNKPDAVTVEPDTSVSRIDLDKIEVASIIQHIGGSQWKVDYYSQVLGSNDQPKPLDLETYSDTQSYKKVTSLILMVQDPLSTSTETDSYVTTLEGSSIIRPLTVKPNRGDVFVADIGNNQKGVFTLTDLKPASHFQQQAYEVSYKMVYRNAPNVVESIEKKVVERLVYREEYLHDGKTPIITEQDNNVLLELHRVRELLINHYMDTFYSHDLNTLLVPDDFNNVYDPNVVQTWRKLVGVNEHQQMVNLSTYNASAVVDLKRMDIWDILFDGRMEYLSILETESKIIPVSKWGSDPSLMSFAYSRLDFCVVPNKRWSVEGLKDDDISTYRSYRFDQASKNRPVDLFKVKNMNEEPDHPILTQMNEYLFSKEFYTQKGDMTKIENVVMKYLKNDTVNKSDLLDLCIKSIKWPYLEAFYYIPVLMILITKALR